MGIMGYTQGVRMAKSPSPNVNRKKPIRDRSLVAGSSVEDFVIAGSEDEDSVVAGSVDTTSVPVASVLTASVLTASVVAGLDEADSISAAFSRKLNSF